MGANLIKMGETRIFRHELQGNTNFLARITGEHEFLDTNYTNYTNYTNGEDQEVVQWVIFLLNLCGALSDLCETLWYSYL